MSQSPETEKLQTALAADIEAASTFMDSEVSPLRSIATDYYHARPFGDEEAGRSRFVMPVVRDTVRATMPHLMRIFFGTQRVVEFSDDGRDGNDNSEAATAAVNYVFTRQNQGFQICWSTFKDALRNKSGWIKWGWHSYKCIKTQTLSGLTEDELTMLDGALLPDESLEVVSKTQVGTQEGEPVLVGIDQMGQPVMQPGEPVPVFEYTVRHRILQQKGQVRLSSVPPEEIIFTRDGTDVGCVRMIGHRCKKRKSELVEEMGIDPSVLEDVGSADTDLETNTERLARQSTAPSYGDDSAPDDDAEYDFVEAYKRADLGTGYTELVKFWCIGAEHKIVSAEPVEEVQLALFCPDPEPHVMLGLSQADYVMDLQRVHSHVFRDILDSLKASIFPRMAYIDGQANPDDVLNTEIGAAIRMRTAGAVTPLEVPFVGQQAFPVIQYLDQTRETRTGVQLAPLAQDASSLQSTAAVAASATILAGQAQVDLIARIFAEWGMKRVFRGILKLLVQHQDGNLAFKLNGKRWDVDPTKWDADMDLVVDTALGSGSTDQKLGVLAQVAQTQTLALQQLGIDNPLCSLQEFYETQKRMLELAGFRDTQRFWRDPAQHPMEPQPPQPTPEQIIAEAEMRIKAAELDTKELDIILKDDLERDRLDADVVLRAAEIRARYGTAVDVANIRRDMERERAERKANESAIRSAVISRPSAAPAGAAGPEPAGAPRRRVVKTPIRDEQGRIAAIHEEEF